MSDPERLTGKIRAALAPCSLGDWPTPLERARALARAAGVPALRLKREDRSAAPCGGNKVRGLEFLLAGARGGTVFVTVGATGSTHCLATAVHAARLSCAVALAQFPQPETDSSRAVAAACAAHAALVAGLASPQPARVPRDSPLFLATARPGGGGRTWGGLRAPDIAWGISPPPRGRPRPYPGFHLRRQGLRRSLTTWNVRRATGGLLAYLWRPCEHRGADGLTAFSTVELTVYPNDCDAFGHLNQAGLAALLERARWEGLARGPGMDLFQRNGVWPALRKAPIE